MDELDRKCDKLLKNKKVRKLYNQIVKEQEENILKFCYNKDNEELMISKKKL